MNAFESLGTLVIFKYRTHKLSLVLMVHLNIHRKSTFQKLDMQVIFYKFSSQIESQLQYEKKFSYKATALRE